MSSTASPVPPPIAYSEARYLSSKKTVDDRALNKDVLERLRRELAGRAEEPLNILEIGAGLGTMTARLVDWGVIGRANYALVDVDRDMLSAARQWLSDWARTRGLVAEPELDALRIRGLLGATPINLRVSFVAQELARFLDSDVSLAPASLLVANAFLDLVDVATTLPRLSALLSPGGLYWLTINYDGDTIFHPEHALDERFMRVYDRSMDERIRFGVPAGSSKTGRSLFTHLKSVAASLLAAGASDWIVYGDNGAYQADERYFLEHIVYTVEQELKNHAELEPASISEWVSRRREQIETGELVYIAHQLDFIARASDRQLARRE